MFGNTLIDNSSKLKLVDTLNEIISMPEINEICIATGYWDLKGTSLVTDALLQFLKRDNTKLRLLIGKDPDIFRKDLTVEAYKNAKVYPQDYLKIDLQNVEMNDQQYQKAALMLINYCADDNQKIQVHVFDINENDESQFFHSKCYIFMSTQGKTCGIIGSSNFTKMGLEGNSELNFLDIDSSHITAKPDEYSPFKGHYYWFNEKWNISKDWTKEFVIAVGNSPVGKAAKEVEKEKEQNSQKLFTILSPKDAYIKVLIDQFGDIVNPSTTIKTSDYIPQDKDFKLLQYQVDAVNQGFSILKRHHGFILADVVGLGKTFTAIMVVKRYLLENAFRQPVLIITPPAIKQNWIDSIAYFDKDSATKINEYIRITTIGTLDEENESQETIQTDDFDDNFINDNYGLVVVDESHRFRNSETQMYQKLEDLLVEKNPYVVLLSATPQNNRPQDIANQIYLFEHERKNSTIDGLGDFGNNLESFFASHEKIYEECIRDYKTEDGNKRQKTQEEKLEDLKILKQISNDIRDKVINQLVIRRTRGDLKDHYSDDMAAQGITFPKIKKPEAIAYQMNGDMAALFTKTVNIIAPSAKRFDIDEKGQGQLKLEEPESLTFARYRAIQYLKDKRNQNIYEYNSKKNSKAGGTITVQNISDRLAGLMEILLVKRLESSQSAFLESLENLLQNTQNMIDMYNADRIFICPDIDVNAFIKKGKECNKSFEVILSDLKAKADAKNKQKQTIKNREFKQADFSKDYKELLEQDKKNIEFLVNQWNKFKVDSKMDRFVMNMNKFMDPKVNKSQKLVVFTECIATQTALVEKFKSLTEYKVLSITADNRDKLKDVIAANFDANYKGEQLNNYNVLITTDVLAEGVNLHRSNTLINYDSPWNATRLMQRLGRINRIGSPAKEIFSYNFYPSAEGDAEINLYKRTLVKLQAFHNMFGEDSQIYTNEEKQVKHNLVEYEEDISENPLIDFIVELNEFRQNEPQKYSELCKIEKPVYTAIQRQEQENCAYCLLHQKDKTADIEQSRFYIKENESVRPENQFDFLTEFKKIVHDEKNQIIQVSNEEYQDSCKQFENAFVAEQLNKNLVLKEKTKIGAKQKEQALLKIRKELLSKAQTEELEEKIGELSESVRSGNKVLIRRLVENDFCDILLLEEEVNELLKLCKPKGNMEALPKVIMICKDNR